MSEGPQHVSTRESGLDSSIGVTEEISPCNATVSQIIEFHLLRELKPSIPAVKVCQATINCLLFGGYGLDSQ